MTFDELLIKKLSGYENSWDTDNSVPVIFGIPDL